MSRPEVPDFLKYHPFTDEELSELWTEICREVLSQDYIRRTHGNSRTYDAGCRGPKCMKGNRERARRRRGSPVADRYVFLDALIDEWYPKAEAKINEAQHDLLSQIAAS